jgi:hypothetical protein
MLCRPGRHIRVQSSTEVHRHQSISQMHSRSVIYIPVSVALINYDAFTNCVSLHNADFEVGLKLKEINDEGFVHSSSLASICIPNSVRYVGGSSFHKCTGFISFISETGCLASEIVRCTKMSNMPEFFMTLYCMFARTVLLLG